MQPVSPLDVARWSWGGADRTVAAHLGRECVVLSSVEGAHVVTVAGAELADGAVEADVSIPHGRSFHGLVWRAHGSDYESFFVRPHQTGNPDAIQYAPVSNGLAAWQLHHGDGFWNPVRLPIDEWFTLRAAFEGGAAALSVGGRQVLHAALRHPVRAGAFGLVVGGDGLRVTELRYTHAATVPAVAPVPVDPCAVAAWEVSEPFPEDEVPETLAPGKRGWTTLEAEPTGLTNLSRAHPIADGRNTVYARTTIASDRRWRRPLELGFSDRAVVFLNGERIYRGDDTYRSRDYRFLGSIGWYDTLYLPLVAGENELVVAVSEDFGGWGLQARLPG